MITDFCPVIGLIITVSSDGILQSYLKKERKVERTHNLVENTIINKIIIAMESLLYLSRMMAHWKEFLNKLFQMIEDLPYHTT